jgi:hypothetical protein
MHRSEASPSIEIYFIVHKALLEARKEVNLRSQCK